MMDRIVNGLSETSVKVRLAAVRYGYKQCILFILYTPFPLKLVVCLSVQYPLTMRNLFQIHFQMDIGKSRLTQFGFNWVCWSSGILMTRIALQIVLRLPERTAETPTEPPEASVNRALPEFIVEFLPCKSDRNSSNLAV